MTIGIPVYIGECGWVYDGKGGEPLTEQPNGIALTDSELEQIKREYFEAGRKLTDRSAPTMDGFFIGGSQVKYTTFEDYEASKKDSYE